MKGKDVQGFSKLPNKHIHMHHLAIGVIHFDGAVQIWVLMPCVVDEKACCCKNTPSMPISDICG